MGVAESFGVSHHDETNVGGIGERTPAVGEDEAFGGLFDGSTGEEVL